MNRDQSENSPTALERLDAEHKERGLISTNNLFLYFFGWDENGGSEISDSRPIAAFAYNPWQSENAPLWKRFVVENEDLYDECVATVVHYQTSALRRKESEDRDEGLYWKREELMDQAYHKLDPIFREGGVDPESLLV